MRKAVCASRERYKTHCLLCSPKSPERGSPVTAFIQSLLACGAAGQIQTVVQVQARGTQTNVSGLCIPEGKESSILKYKHMLS